MNYDLLLHVDSDDAKVLNLAFNNADNYAKALPDENFHMVLVANGPAVKLFVNTNTELAERGKALTSRHLDIRLCSNALKANNLDSTELWKCCKVVPAGVVEIVKLQREGFAYIKP